MHVNYIFCIKYQITYIYIDACGWLIVWIGVVLGRTVVGCEWRLTTCVEVILRVNVGLVMRFVSIVLA